MQGVAEEVFGVPASHGSSAKARRRAPYVDHRGARDDFIAHGNTGRYPRQRLFQHDIPQRLCVKPSLSGPASTVVHRFRSWHAPHQGRIPRPRREDQLQGSGSHLAIVRLRAIHNDISPREDQDSARIGSAATPVSIDRISATYFQIENSLQIMHVCLFRMFAQ